MVRKPWELDDDQGDDELGPSLALPPLYVLRTTERCPDCRKLIPVHALACTAYRDAEEGYTITQFHILTAVQSVPEAVMELLRDKVPSFFLDREAQSEPPYLMNHCSCGAKLTNDFLHGDLGAAFCPDTLDGYAHIKLRRLPVTEPIPLESSYALGYAEFLNFAQAEVW